MQKDHFLLLKKLKNTTSAQLCLQSYAENLQHVSAVAHSDVSFTSVVVAVARVGLYPESTDKTNLEF